MKFLKSWVLVLFMMTSSSFASFEQAEMLYRNQQYQSALAVYLPLYESSPRVKGLAYNVGNVYLKLGEVGPAILFYRRALKMSPRDPDIQHNLTLARRQVLDQEKQSTWSLGALIYRFTLNEWFVAMTVFLSLWVIVLGMFFLYKKRDRFRYAAVILFFLTAVSTVCTWVVYDHVEASKWGVVMAQKESVHSGPSVSLPILFYVHEGGEFDFIKSVDQWVLIRLENGFEGWVKRSSITYI